MLVPFSVFFSSRSLVHSIRSIALPWPLVTLLTKTLFIQRSPSALERSTVPQWVSMYTLERESWVQTPLPPYLYQTFAPHAGEV